MEKTQFRVVVVVVVLLAALGGIALAAQDRYTVKVPNGLAFADFKGYDTWQNVAVSETEGSVKAILGNRSRYRLTGKAFRPMASFSPTAPRSQRSSG